MTVKTSISLTDSQEAFARDLVERGVFPSVSAVLQRGLEMLRSERDLEQAELDGLRHLIEERRRGPFMSMAESKREIEQIIADFKESDLDDEAV